MDKVTTALDDDLNVAAAWGHIFDWVRNTNRDLSEGKLTPQQAAAHLTAWESIDAVFGVGAKQSITEVPAELLALLDEREAARKARNFKRADEIRSELKAKGWVIEDTPKGPKLKRI